jgi:hypothetical protein
MIVIKKCPYCGGEANLIAAMGEWWVDCAKNCTDLAGSPETAIKRWNKRMK